jgi:phosphomannomutase
MTGNPQDKLLFSVAGARGIVGRGLDVDVVTRLTLAFVSILPPGPVVVGRDTRPSGRSLLSAVLGAVTAAGRECINLGIATTPTVELTVEKLEAAGGIITYDRGSQEHIDAILGLHIIDVDRITRRSFRIVVDCINGAGSVIAPDLLEALGVDVVRLNCKLDGDFYRDPEPRAENLNELAERVKTESADLGFALDPDADRLALVDNQGRALSEEMTLPLVVDQVLRTEKKGPVVVNMSTSALVDWVASQYQATVFRTPVGEAHVVDKMLGEHAPVGGEGNGGVIYPELHAGRDAMVGMALILQLLAERNTTLADHLEAYPVFYMSKDKVALGGEFSAEAISDLIRGLGPARIDTVDGVKAIFDDGWCHIRVSNTEGIVRIITESMTEERTTSLRASAREVLYTAWNK